MPQSRRRRNVLLPKYPWSLVDAIPWRRLTAIAKTLNYDVDGRYDWTRAQHAKALAQMNKAELTHIARGFGVKGRTISKGEMIQELVKPARPKLHLRALTDVRESIEDVWDSQTLRIWLDYYLRAAKAEGIEVDLANGCREVEMWPGAQIEGTIRLVCDIYSLIRGEGWLENQTYKKPLGRGPWWEVRVYDYPHRWCHGRYFARNPRDVPFWAMFMANNRGAVELLVSRRDRRPLSSKTIKELIEIARDDMRYEYDDEEFLLSCARDRNALYIDLMDRDEGELQDYHVGPDKDGLYWW